MARFPSDEPEYRGLLFNPLHECGILKLLKINTHKEMLAVTWKDTYQEWLNQDQLEPALKEQLVAMDDDQEKEDAFYGPLSFGTAGMRGLMVPGLTG